MTNHLDEQTFICKITCCFSLDSENSIKRQTSLRIYLSEKQRHQVDVFNGGHELPELLTRFQALC